MKHRVFSIFDQKAVAYLPPFVLPERGMALRTFGDALNEPKHAFGAHPEDYVLFEIGMFDDRSAILEPHTAPELVSTGLSLLEAGKPRGNQMDLSIPDDDFLGES